MKILIKAYTQVNLGDDLFIKMLCNRYPEVAFTLVCNKKLAKPYEEISNLKIIHPPRYIDGFLSKIGIKYNMYNKLNNKIAKKSDTTVHIGGSIFIQKKENWKETAEIYTKSIRNSNGFFVLGCNFGPFEDNEFLNSFRKTFNKVNDICFREKKSYDLFSDISSSRMAPDIVFGLKTNDISIYKHEKYIVISVINLANRDSLNEYLEAYEKSIINISKKLIQKQYEVVLMSFCQYEGDEGAINRILKQYHHDNIHAYFYHGDIEESLSIINSSEGVVASRFHSMVLSLVFNKPVFPFIYSSKTLNVIEDISFDGYYSQISEAEILDVNLVIEQLINQEPYKVEQQKQEANRHFMMLDQFIEEGKK